ncbi:hypothetical protein Pan97_44820 [Bremerella volcania]|uniref:Uncharacterized protein n=1 Tax=Bremerella volcania TaxID=2527984 RepID=A0A518CDW6_9BACT|nr:hypothetical protein Pan97_44820 [Bremerella volcania]
MGQKPEAVCGKVQSLGTHKHVFFAGRTDYVGA